MSVATNAETATPSEASAAIALRLFGTFTLIIQGQPAPPLSRSARALIALLAVQGNGGRRPLERDFVAATLWPDSDDAAAHYNLRRTLTEVRSALGAEVGRLDAPRGMQRVLRLDLTSDGAWCDVVAFDSALAQADRGDEKALRVAIDLYASGGGLLEGQPGEWLYPEREARKEQYLAAQERLARRLREQGMAGEAIEPLRAVLALDPLRETAVRELMTALSESGQAASALATYQSLRVRLQKEAGAVPDTETAALYRQLYQDARRQAENAMEEEAGEGAATAPASHLPLNNLPHPLTALIGRERDCVEAIAHLRAHKDRPSARLLTLLGAGGMGKTRLAITVARAIAPHYEQGVCFVDFAPTDAATRVLAVVVNALQLTEPAGNTSEEDRLRFLENALRPRRLLLVFDNCEHVVAEVSRLTIALLNACPHLTVLATSREPLHIPGEVIWRVSGLPSDEASKLFLMRATDADSRFRLQAAPLEAVRAIVTRLDGIPLAIEMAAARTRVLPVAEIAARLDNVFRLLTQSGGDLLPRHQTLRATLDWSYDLLDAAEKTLLARLSVFPGGWTLDAAERVCAGEGILPDDVFDLLSSLIEKSLVQFQLDEREDSARYRMLETIRQYASEKLRQSGEEPTIRKQHRDWCLALAEEAEPHLSGAEVAGWSDRLEREHDSLRVALDDCATQALSDEASESYAAVLASLRIAAALMRFWWIRGYLSEGRNSLQRALALQTRIAPPMAQEPVVKKAAANALNAAGVLAWRQGDYSAARSAFEDSLALSRELGDKRGIATTLGNLGNVALDRSEYAAARSLDEESLTLYREIGDKRGIANMLGCLGNVAANQGDYATAQSLREESLDLHREIGDRRGMANRLNDLGNIARDLGQDFRAQPLYEQSLTLFREIGDREGIGITLNNLGNIAVARGDYSGSRPLYAESLTIYRETGFRSRIAITLINLSTVVCHAGDYAEAQRLLEESLRISRETGDFWLLSHGLDAMGRVFLGMGDFRRAVTLWASAKSLRESRNIPLSATEQEERETQLAEARAEIGEEAFANAWSEGWEMPQDREDVAVTAP